jgi:Mg-chelatase subunit ChlD
MSASVIPDEFLCPITGEIMMDPVNVCAEGHIFERAAINQWSLTRNNCPTCRTPLGSHRPERHLKQAITDWLCTHPQAGGGGGLMTRPFKDGAIAVKAETFSDDGKTFLHLTAETDSAGGKQGGVYIIGLDNSGSMADLTDSDNKEIFYTRMDLAKHTINSVAAMLGSEDFLAVVSFSNAAKIVLEPTRMDDAGRGKLKAILQTVQPDSMTNIDAAIRSMMSIANRPEMKGRAIFGALLTDGAETVIPSPSGTVKALTRLEMTNPWILSTFGFGYQLNSVLLTQLSEMALAGGGSFGFIPDLTMIGTVFINWVANAMVMGTRDAIIQYSVNSGSPVSIHTGPLAIGQPRDYLVQIPAGASVKVFAAGMEIIPSMAASLPEYAIARNMYLAAMEQVISVSENGRTDDVFGYLSKIVQRFADSMDPRVKALLLDIESVDPSEGQIGMAPRYWMRWGGHYMRSYRRAQQIQRRLNFKDPGSLIYGGDEASLFGQCVVKGEELFMTLDPPQPTGVSRYNSSSSAAPAYDPAYLSAYLSQQSQAAQSGGCFHPETPVLMANGSIKQIQSLSPGDQVWTPHGAASVIALVTVGHGSATSVMMSKVGDCILTPYHPYLNEVLHWVVGADTVGQESYPTGTVYNLLLDKFHIIKTPGGISACTLAHGFTENVIAHPFFGTKAVVEDLKKCSGWLEGRPVYKNLQVRRSNGVIVEWFDAP